MPKPPPIGRAPIGALVKLRRESGPEIPCPAVLITFSGRRYDVINVRGKTLHCIVMPADAEVEPGTPVLEWRWTARDKKIEP